MLKYERLLILLMTWLCCASVEAAEVIPLSGTWRFATDAEKAGISDKWYKLALPGEAVISLPGSLQEQGFGHDFYEEINWDREYSVKPKNYPFWFTHAMYEPYRRKDNLRFPYYLQPEKYYVGWAWYQREIEIPAGWKEKTVTLVLERCHWASTLYVNGRKIGYDDSLATAHRYDLSSALRPGTNTLTILVDNSMVYPVGSAAHSVTDQTQTMWNGIVGRIELQARAAVAIRDIQIYPNIERRHAKVVVAIESALGNRATAKVQFQAARDGDSLDVLRESVGLEKGISRHTLYYPIAEPLLWDEFSPNLYTLTVEITSEAGSDSQEVRFGFREFKVEGTQFSINGRKTFLRGTLECCIFPLTGYPGTDVESWTRIFRACKEYGLNTVRFHSWCPPEAAFAAADAVGIYLQPEVNLWGKVDSERIFDFLKRESRRMLRDYGNHPSFVMMSLGNESWVEPQYMNAFLTEWQKDSRRVYTGPANNNHSVTDAYEYYVARAIGNKRIRYQSGWPPRPQNTLFVTQPPRTTLDFGDVILPYGKPLIAHETVQYCSYPDIDDVTKYTGSLSPGYLYIAKDQLKQNGLWAQRKAFISASGLWQVQLFKESIEAHLRTPGMGGFHLLDLHDFPGQGGALVGVLDAFWDSKGYVTPEEFRRFCGPTVPLARMEKRVWRTDETLKADIEIAHYGPEPLNDARVIACILNAESEAILTNKLSLPAKKDRQQGLLRCGSVVVDLSDFETPGRYRLAVFVQETEIANDWDFWVYPERLESQAGRVNIVHAFDESTRKLLEQGRTVLLLPDIGTIRGDIPQCFTSIYWNCPWTDGGESQTLGILCDPTHPVFRHFPTESHTNWQWWELLTQARPMILDGWGVDSAWPKTYRPLVQLIDDWNQNRKLGVLAEAKVGPGRLMICAMDIENDLDSRPVARQLRHSLIRYMNSEDFDPKTALSVEQIESLFRR